MGEEHGANALHTAGKRACLQASVACVVEGV